MLERLGPVVRSVSQDERSQYRNRELAVDRIVEQVAEAVRPRRRRKPTEPTEASRERRLEGKRRQSALKQSRRAPAAPED